MANYLITTHKNAEEESFWPSLSSALINIALLIERIKLIFTDTLKTVLIIYLSRYLNICFADEQEVEI